MDVFAMKQSCSSKSSSISSTSIESHEVVTNTKKMKEKVVEGSQLEPYELSVVRALLDLKFQNGYNNNTNKNKINGSNHELNLFHPTPAHASDSSNEATPKQRHSLNARTFSCRFCKKKFPTYHALGRHQNAHEQERVLAKMRNQLVDVGSPFRPPNYHSYYHPYSNSNSHLPIHCSLATQSLLGVQGDSSAIHRPPLENSLNIENKTSGKGLNLMDDDMKIGLGVEEEEKDNEEELDLDLKL
ncbi:hypothetical protein HAX54_020372 [Datura stramonium]|uniref:C2H2-type domain-containing protein n=1 Tax=Datura stramonium TaxID=4076 RepID=A0ABS8US58_DATST|nr:hypothetical protein [Datura stramonium]